MAARRGGPMRFVPIVLLLVGSLLALPVGDARLVFDAGRAQAYLDQDPIDDIDLLGNCINDNPPPIEGECCIRVGPRPPTCVMDP